MYGQSVIYIYVCFFACAGPPELWSCCLSVHSHLSICQIDVWFLIHLCRRVLERYFDYEDRKRCARRLATFANLLRDIHVYEECVMLVAYKSNPHLSISPLCPNIHLLLLSYRLDDPTRLTSRNCINIRTPGIFRSMPSTHALSPIHQQRRDR